MANATAIFQKSNAILAAHARAVRANRIAHIETMAAKYALTHPVGPIIVRHFLGRALAAQNDSLYTMARLRRLHGEIAEEWAHG